jgi:dUTP pyrophosphatase
MKKPLIKFFKTHPDAQLPKQNYKGEGIGDTGFDLICVEDTIVFANSSAIIPVGIKVAYIEPGYWFKIEARSGLGFVFNLEPHCGIIDNSYRGDCGVKIFNFNTKDYLFKKGDKVAQLIVYELIQPTIEWANEIEKTERGEKGFGSSDKKC